MKSAKRPYRLQARAEAAEQNRERILDAVEQLFWERDPDEFTLEDIAERAGLTLQTVLRKFGSKDGAIEAAIEERAGAVMNERKPPAPGAVAAVSALVASYEKIGDANWRMLRHEAQRPLLAKVLAGARAFHRTWIEESFASSLPTRGAARERMVDALFTALDFYVWKLHRRDLGRTREQTEALMLGLVTAVLDGKDRRVG